MRRTGRRTRNTIASRIARFILICAVLGLAWPGIPAQPSPAGSEPDTARRIERRGDLVSIISGDIHVPANLRQHGMIFCLGGDVTVEGQVSQDVVVVFGSVTVTGSVGGTVTSVMASQELNGAEIGHDSVNILGSQKLIDSHVDQNLVNVLGFLDKDDLSYVGEQVVNIGLGGWAPGIWALLFWIRLFHKFVIFVLLVLIVALVPERVRELGDEISVRYVTAFFIGILGYLAYWILMTLLLVTFVGAPLLEIGFVVMKWIGIAAIFHVVGRRLGRAFGMEMSTLGATLLVFGLYVLVFMVPAAFGLFGLLVSLLLNFLFLILVAVPAVGIAILSFVDRRERRGAPVTGPPLAPKDVAPVTPPASAVPPPIQGISRGTTGSPPAEPTAGSDAEQPPGEPE